MLNGIWHLKLKAARMLLIISAFALAIRSLSPKELLVTHKKPLTDSVNYRLRAVSSKINFTLPLKHMRITSPFGYRIHPINKVRTLHKGVDLRAKKDTVLSILGGDVIAVKQSRSLGKYIKIRHMNGLYTIYGHLSKQLVHPKQKISTSTPIGITGNTGLSTAEHLHFGVYVNGKPTDPMQFFKQLYQFNKAMEKQHLQELIQQKFQGLASNPNQPITLTAEEAEALEVQLWDEENIIEEVDHE